MINQWLKFLEKYYGPKKVNIDANNIEEYIYTGVGLVMLEPIQRIGGYIRANPPELGIKDASELPFKKRTIISILIMTLLLEKDDVQNNALRKLLTEVIPRFQEYVGNDPLFSGGSKVSIFRLFDVINKFKSSATQDENVLRKELDAIYDEYGEKDGVDQLLKDKYDLLQKKSYEDIGEMFEIIELIDKYKVFAS